jgi:two-component system chemotaxis response regulator CheB
MSLPIQQIVPPVVPLPAIRVMIVDDAVVVRGLVSRWIGAEPDMLVAGTCANGREAVDSLTRVEPDVVVLDVEMPELDGLGALPQLLAKRPNLVVVMASTVTRRNAEISLRALALGASDYVPKPETNREITTSQDFRRELIEKIRSLGRRRLRRPARPGEAGAEAARAPIRLRPFSKLPPKALFIGCSTGGPQALQLVARALSPALAKLPVLIAQHMPPTFTTILAEHLERETARPAHEGVDGEPLAPGTIYVAPGGRHMRVEQRGAGPSIVLDDSAPVHFCRPAVDPLFASAAATIGGNALALVLTGMGSDGAAGAAAIAKAGGSVIAQDEASSVVWGMPGAAAHTGACSAVLPLEEIGPRVIRLMQGDTA